MEYEFHIQDPTSPSTVYLFEAIIGAVQDAIEWQGMFAFASRGGVNALISDPEVETFLNRGSMSLIVGIDAITNHNTLERLRELEATYSRFQARVFWNSSGGLFHPKLSHFRYPDGRKVIIVGSGNLTPGGLRENFEAFSIAKFSARERVNLSGWDEFLRNHAANIRVIDAAALERAARNIVTGRRRLRVRETPEPDTDAIVVPSPAEEAEVVLIGAGEADRVLVANVPKAGGRWHQVHFNRDVIAEFFRVQPNSIQRVYLREVRQDRTFGDQEVRPCVYSQSNKNHKIELSAHSGEVYPGDGKPIVVFRELQARSFAYMLLMPGENGYQELQSLLERLPQIGKGDKRVLTNIGELNRSWPTCPLVTQVEIPGAT